jgi:hypothetical protein
MKAGKALRIALYTLLLLALALAFIYYVNQPPKPLLVRGAPAGLFYGGPPTTALAGWFCVEDINSSNGFSIQLNAQLGNGYVIQNVYTVTPQGQAMIGENAWLCTFGLCIPLSAAFINTTPTHCAWLITALKGEFAYIGYSLDGKNIIWYAAIHVGSTHIIPTIPILAPNGYTNIVLAGYGNGAQAQLGSGTLVYLAMYYWNGNNWQPAPVGALKGGGGIGETVNHAWEFTNGYCGGYVTWPGASPSGLGVACPTPNFHLTIPKLQEQG